MPGFEDGVSELYRPPSDGVPAARIPLTYDWNGKGGWHMHFIPAGAVVVAQQPQAASGAKRRGINEH